MNQPEAYSKRKVLSLYLKAETESVFHTQTSSWSHRERSLKVKDQPIPKTMVMAVHRSDEMNFPNYVNKIKHFEPGFLQCLNPIAEMFSLFTCNVFFSDPFCSKGFARVKGNICVGKGCFEVMLTDNVLLFIQVN